jgi:beta-N-acetylhexosaminidase
MTAHVVFSALDPHAPATTSRTVIRDVIRGAIGFGGLLMSDDLSMQALSGSLRHRAEAAFAAGCDIALHCNGDLAEMQFVAQASPALEGLSRERAGNALARLPHAPEPFDPVDARAAFEAALALAA